MDITATGMNNFTNASIDSILSSGVRGAASSEDQKLREATLDFETLFVKQMLNSMKKTINKSGLLDGGMGQDIFEDMLYDEYAKKIASTANLGIAEMMFQQLSTKRPEF
ncbi:MAG: rod-binding protein [Spirochaetaceae bacterium]|jgi:flagellar protein FlgJ|nr:rod-binding protein [Spirochaetaceae bacterium]